MSSSTETIDRLEVEIRMLRGSLEAVTNVNDASSSEKMAAIAKCGLRESRKRVALSEAVETRSLIEPVGAES